MISETAISHVLKISQELKNLCIENSENPTFTYLNMILNILKTTFHQIESKCLIYRDI